MGLPSGCRFSPRKIARMMYLAMLDSTPQQLDYQQWHLPFTPPGGLLKWIPQTDGEAVTWARYRGSVFCWEQKDKGDK